MAKGLTRRQAEILSFIVTCIRDNGMPPTIDEIGRRFNISSTNGVNDHLVALTRK
ncbi:MAG TPA: repressor LexA, partial [Candidatus Hydrogenedentes bacterium]|nr:repressor LexA [Candidatus Hydrogenedentota bacterium]